jgi:hypothetical protein
MGVPVPRSFLWVLTNLTSGEIEEWVERRVFGCDDLATVTMISNDIHELLQKACGNTVCDPGEQEKALDLLTSVEEKLKYERDSSRIHVYYQRRIRKLRSETGQNYCKPSAEEMMEGYIKLCMAAMDIWSKAKSTLTSEAVPSLSNIFYAISKGMDDFGVSLGSEQQPSTTVGRSIAYLHEQLTLLHTSTDALCPRNLAWAYRQTNRIILERPEPSTSLSDVLESREED